LSPPPLCSPLEGAATALPSSCPPPLRCVVWKKKGHLLQANVSSVLDVSEVYCKCFMRMLCKSRSGCYICCIGCTDVLQASVPNVSSVFLDVCCKFVYLDVAYVLHMRCKCFIWMLRMFYNGFQVFL
jgi:hypothetical protein